MGGVSRHKSGRAKSGRMAARGIQADVRRRRRSAEIINPWLNTEDGRQFWPFPYRSVLRLMSDPYVQAAIRGDGSRRRCGEVREGLRHYKQWLSDGCVSAIADIFSEAQEMFRHLSAKSQRTAVYASLEYSFNDKGGITSAQSIRSRQGFTIHSYLHDYTPNPIRVEQRAQLWICRLQPDLPQEDAFARACEIAQMSDRDRRSAIRHLRDRVYRGLHRPRSTIQRKLTVAQVLDIRHEYQAGSSSMAFLGTKHGVSPAMINQVVSGGSYKSVGGPIKPRGTQ